MKVHMGKSQYSSTWS